MAQRSFFYTSVQTSNLYTYITLVPKPNKYFQYFSTISNLYFLFFHLSHSTHVHATCLRFKITVDKCIFQVQLVQYQNIPLHAKTSRKPTILMDVPCFYLMFNRNLFKLCFTLYALNLKFGCLIYLQQYIQLLHFKLIAYAMLVCSERIWYQYHNI